MAEGVIRFSTQHEHAPLDVPGSEALCGRLTAWRHVLRAVGLVGQHPDRYEGLGYGNLSARVDIAASEPLPGKRPFLITGSQTGARSMLESEHYCLVATYDFSANRVVSRGQIRPSSESLTHGAIYDLSSDIRFVFHAHSPEIWHHAPDLGLPTTDPLAAYGTPEMARAVQRAWRAAGGPINRVIAMGGHEDGVVAFGESADSAAMVLLQSLTAALQFSLKRPSSMA